MVKKCEICGKMENSLYEVLEGETGKPDKLVNRKLKITIFVVNKNDLTVCEHCEMSGYPYYYSGETGKEKKKFIEHCLNGTYMHFYYSKKMKNS